MANRSNDSSNNASKKVATIGYMAAVPVQRSVSGGFVGNYQNKSQVSYSDTQSGCYGRQTTTEKASAGDFHWQNGTTGTRSEYTQSSTVRVGDRGGYTEVRNEQTVRNVTYDRSDCGSKNYGGYGNNNSSGGSYVGDGNKSSYGGYSYNSTSGGGSYIGYGNNSSGGGSYGGYGYSYVSYGNNSSGGGSYGGYASQ